MPVASSAIVQGPAAQPRNMLRAIFMCISKKGFAVPWTSGVCIEPSPARNGNPKGTKQSVD
jgi:hypothetical protein